jgi:hypothetical protein
MYNLPVTPRRFRLFALASGAAIFFWLSIEDTNIIPAIFFGADASLLIGLYWLFKKLGSKSLSLNGLMIGAILFGALVGAGSTLTTAALMLLKNGSHGHVFPDYPLGMIVEILLRAPAWALAGGFLGLGFSLLYLVSHRQS